MGAQDTTTARRAGDSAPAGEGSLVAVWAAAAPFLPATLRTLGAAHVPYVVLPEALDDVNLGHAAEAEVLVVGGALVAEELLTVLPRLRLIVRAGVGVDRIDLEAAARRDIVVTNIPDYGVHEVADHTLLLILACARRLRVFGAQSRTCWSSVDYVPVPRLRGRRLGIVGLGRIGTAVAARARSIGMDVAAYDPLISDEHVARADAAAVDLPDLLATSDVITLHAPLTPDTRHMLGAEAFALLRRAPVVVNTARGELIDTAALIRALDDGVVSAAGLDVLDGEPDVSRHDALFGRDDVVITPHVAWYSQDSRDELGSRAAQTALDFVVHGIRPPGVDDDTPPIAPMR